MWHGASSLSVRRGESGKVGKWESEWVSGRPSRTIPLPFIPLPCPEAKRLRQWNVRQGNEDPERRRTLRATGRFNGSLRTGWAIAVQRGRDRRDRKKLRRILGQSPECGRVVLLRGIKELLAWERCPRQTGSMKTNLPLTQDNALRPFLNQYGSHVIGHLSGYDRLRLRGTLRPLYHAPVMERYLSRCHVRLLDFKTFVQRTSQRICTRAKAWAAKLGRSFQYLSSNQQDKEALARQIATTQGITDGLITLLGCVEPCKSFRVQGGYSDHLLHLKLEPRQCLHLYFYCLHPHFGLMHLRLQTWFPFQIDVCLNGREWLCRQLEAAGLAYRRQGNCVVQVQDWARAQALLNTQVQWDWPKTLEGLRREFHPLSKELCRPLELSYYWSVSESEYATDLVFRDAATLARLYPQWVRHAITTFGCTDVMRYLGRRVPTEAGRVPGHFAGEVISDIKSRQEGVRAKHSVNGNSVKMYDKAYTPVGNVFRVETTTNRPQEFRTFRRAEGQTQGLKRWHVLRRSVADMPRRAEISLAVNGRYLAALASTSGTTPLAQSAAKLCRPVRRQGRRYRGMNPWSPPDAALLEVISCADFAIAGLRNRDLQTRLFENQKVSALERRRRANRITRRLALLRAHGLLRKVSGTHRYLLTAKGRAVITALLAARQASVEQLNKMAA